MNYQLTIFQFADANHVDVVAEFEKFRLTPICVFGIYQYYEIYNGITIANLSKLHAIFQPMPSYISCESSIIGDKYSADVNI